MPSLIDTLYEQHRRMFTLLSLLQREVEAFAVGKAFDPYLVEATLDYIAEYPDRLHRPIELKLYEALGRARGGEDPLATTAAANEHADLSAAAREVRNAVTALGRGGAVLPRSWIADKAHRLIDGLRSHMEHEEATVLPACRSALSTEVLAQVQQQIEADHSIPAIQAEEHAYSALYQTVVAQDRIGIAAKQ